MKVFKTLNCLATAITKPIYYVGLILFLFLFSACDTVRDDNIKRELRELHQTISELRRSISSEKVELSRILIDVKKTIF